MDLCHSFIVLINLTTHATCILDSEVEIGFINCSLSAHSKSIILCDLCFRASILRSHQDEEQFRHSDACLFILRISTQCLVSSETLLLLLDARNESLHPHVSATVIICLLEKLPLH